MLISIIIFLLSYTTLNFEFKSLTINPSSNVVGEVTQYEIVYDRSINNVLSRTPWDRQAVFAGSLIYAFFPEEYYILSSFCKSVSITYFENSVITTREASTFMCSIFGKTFAIEGAIPINMFIIKIVLKLGNITNPIPALILRTFKGKIGNDQTTVGGRVQLYPAEFQNCLITFQPPWVNITSTMIIIINPRNTLNTSAYILVSTPSRWANDISNISHFSINQIMNCYSYNQTTISNTPTCSGNSLLFTINISNLFTDLTFQSFQIAINNIVSPPTLQPNEPFIITSYINGYAVDSCTASVTGLIPNRFFNLSITPDSTKVNSNSALQFRIILADYCDQYDDLQITFPSQISIILYSWNSTADYYGTNVSGNVYLFTHIRQNQKLYQKGSLLVLKIFQIKLPPSSKPAYFIVKILRNGYQKMEGTTYFRPQPSTITGNITLSSYAINQISSYSFNLVLPDYLSSSGKIKIIFPNQISLIQPIWGTDLIGTSVRSNPMSIYVNSNKSLLILSINSSNANIPAQTLTIVVHGVQNPSSVAQSGSFFVTTYFTEDEEGIVSLGTLAGISALNCSPHITIPNFINNVCDPCNIQCATCFGNTGNCTACSSTAVFYNGSCATECPQRLIMGNNTCVQCNQNCQTCSFLYDNCTTCDILSSYPYFFNFSCVSSCPINYTSNGTHCISNTNIILTQTLSASNIFPVPFSFVGAMIGIVCIVSKIKHSKTLLCKSLFSFWSVLEWGSIVFGGVIYFVYNNKFSDRYFILFLTAGCLMYLLNLFGLFFQTWHLKKLPLFKQWQKKKSNSYFYLFVVLFSTLVTHKFKNILFCKLFELQIFSTKVRDVFIFRIFSLVSLIPSAISLYVSSSLLSQNTQTSSYQFMNYIDIIIITSVCIILSFVQLTEKLEKTQINNEQDLLQDFDFELSKKKKKKRQGKQRMDEQDQYEELEQKRKKQFKKNYIDTGVYYMYI